MSEKVSEKVMARAKAVPILKKLPVFEGLLEGELLKVLSMCSSANLDKGQTLFKQGDDGTSLYILLAGELDIIVEGSGVVHVMKPSEIVGEIGLVCQVQRTASAVARERAVLLHLYADIFHEVVKKHPRIGYVIMRNVAVILANRVMEHNKKDAQ